MPDYMVSYESGPVTAENPRQAAEKVLEGIREPGTYPPLLEVVNLETDETTTFIDIQKEDP